MFETNLLIGGETPAASGGATFLRNDPATGKAATRAPAANVEDADRADEAALAAFPAWAALLPGQRRALLLKAADTMEARRAEFVACGIAEVGGSPAWYGFNVTLASNILREAASMTTQIAG